MSRDHLDPGDGDEELSVVFPEVEVPRLLLRLGRTLEDFQVVGEPNFSHVLEPLLPRGTGGMEHSELVLDAGFVFSNSQWQNVK